MKTKREFCEATMKYMDEHSEECTPDSVSEAVEYSERVFLRKFREYYGVPFTAFLKKLQLHRAAAEICKNGRVLHVRKLTGFATPQSFSKAFKNEFGVAPRQFLNTDKRIPDLEVSYKVHGEVVEVEYREDVGLDNMSHYVVFSVRLGGGYQIQDEFETIRELKEYVFHQWMIINRKILCTFGQVKEKVTKEKIYVCVPVFKNGVKEPLAEKPNVAADEWIRYIDEHIKEELSIKEVAKHFGYSERHFYDIFQMHFHIRPGHYIKKRRLFLAARSLQNYELTIEEVVQQYRYSSVNAFRRAFFKAFKTKPENYSGEEYKVDNMKQYYVEHKGRVKVSFEDTETIHMTDQEAVSRRKSIRQEELTDYIINRLLENEENQIVVWKTIRKRSECLVGPLIVSAENVPEEFAVSIKGGKYAVIESNQASDEDNLKKMYQMLYRLAFAGWLWENWSEIDFSRLSYVRYREGKLYFYVPVIG